MGEQSHPLRFGKLMRTHEPCSDCTFQHYAFNLWGPVTCQKACDASALPAMKTFVSLFQIMTVGQLSLLLLCGSHWQLFKSAATLKTLTALILQCPFISVCMCVCARVCAHMHRPACVKGLTKKVYAPAFLYVFACVCMCLYVRSGVLYPWLCV